MAGAGVHYCPQYLHSPRLHMEFKLSSLCLGWHHSIGPPFSASFDHSGPSDNCQSIRSYAANQWVSHLIPLFSTSAIVHPACDLHFTSFSPLLTFNCPTSVYSLFEPPSNSSEDALEGPSNHLGWVLFCSVATLIKYTMVLLCRSQQSLRWYVGTLCQGSALLLTRHGTLCIFHSATLTRHSLEVSPDDAYLPKSSTTLPSPRCI